MYQVTAITAKNNNNKYIPFIYNLNKALPFEMTS